MTLEGRRVAVIGSGFGGLALAIRLQSAGVQTTVLEARDKPGGRAYYWQQDGFTFDAGPTVVTDPACLQELWELSGHDIRDDVELMPVFPFYRLMWPDGASFDYSNDDRQLRNEIAKLDPFDIAGYEEFLRYSAAVYEEGYVKLGTVPFLDFKSMIKAAPALAKHQAWRSVYSIVSKYVRNEHLREALTIDARCLRVRHSDLFADVQHRRLVALPFADDDRAVDRHRVHALAHGLDRHLVGLVPVALPHRVRAGNRRLFDHGKKVERKV